MAAYGLAPLLFKILTIIFTIEVSAKQFKKHIKKSKLSEDEAVNDNQLLYQE